MSIKRKGFVLDSLEACKELVKAKEYKAMSKAVIVKGVTYVAYKGFSGGVVYYIGVAI